MSQDVSVLALVKGEERYVFLIDDASTGEALRTLGRFASNPDLSFTWLDAATLSQKIRNGVPKQPRPGVQGTVWKVRRSELGCEQQ